MCVCVYQTRSNRFALDFYIFFFFHFRIIVEPRCFACLFLGLRFHAPHVRHFVKIAFVTLVVPATNALDSHKGSKGSNAGKNNNHSNNERYPSIIIINF